MKKQGDNFVVTLHLLPGAYEYKFMVDGEWQTSPTQPKSALPPQNNAIVVSPSIRTSLQGLRTKSGKSFIFLVKTSLPLETLVEKAKAMCHVEGAYHLALRDGSQVQTTDEIAEGDTLFLDRDDNANEADAEPSSESMQLLEKIATDHILVWTKDDPSIKARYFPSQHAANDWMKTVDPEMKLKWITKDTRLASAPMPQP